MTENNAQSAIITTGPTGSLGEPVEDDPETLRRERDAARGESVRLEAWGHQMAKERDDLAARLAAAISMIETLGEDYGLEDVSDQRAIAKLRDIDLPARAAAVLRVVEAARRCIQHDADDDLWAGADADLRAALRALDGEALAMITARRTPGQTLEADDAR